MSCHQTWLEPRTRALKRRGPAIGRRRSRRSSRRSRLRAADAPWSSPAVRSRMHPHRSRVRPRTAMPSPTRFSLQRRSPQPWGNRRVGRRDELPSWPVRVRSGIDRSRSVGHRARQHGDLHPLGGRWLQPRRCLSSLGGASAAAPEPERSALELERVGVTRGVPLLQRPPRARHRHPPRGVRPSPGAVPPVDAVAERRSWVGRTPMVQAQYMRSLRPQLRIRAKLSRAARPYSSALGSGNARIPCAWDTRPLCTIGMARCPS